MSTRNFSLALVFILLLSAVSVAALDTTYSRAWYVMNDSTYKDYDFTGNGFNLTTSGATYINGTHGYDYDGANDYSDTTLQETYTDFTVGMWVQANDWVITTSSDHFINSWVTGVNSGWFSLSNAFDSSAKHRFTVDFGDDDCGYKDINTGASGTDGVTWKHIAGVLDSSNSVIKLYIDGVNVANTSTAGCGDLVMDNTAVLGQRADKTNSEIFGGNIVGAFIHNESLNTTTIQDIYNQGREYDPFVITGANNFTLTAKNLWNNASITTFNATINGTDYNTTTGSIVTPYLDNESVLVNITVTAENFFENTTLNVNTSSNFQAGLYKYTEIYARDIINDSSIPNFTVYYESLNDSSDNGTETTTSGTAYLPLFNATYNLTIQSANIDTQYYSTDSDTEAANLYLRNHTFYLFRSNTANITFYHERSLDLADDINISASLIIEGVWANNYTIGNGALFLENLNTGNYEIRYASIGYPERSYFFTLSNNTYTQISLYIANGTHTTEVTNTLYDELGNKLSDYYIRLLRYYVGTNSYLLVDECRTNFGGICVLNAELSSETQSVYYKFRIVGPDGTVYKTTQSTRIYETSLTHFISLSSSIIDELQELNTISYDVDFLTATNQFKYTWDDSSGTLSSATLSVYRLTSNGTEILNSTTTTASSSGTIYIAVTNDNTTTYIAKAFAGSNFVQSVDHSFFNTVDIFGRFGIFLTMIIVIAIVSLGIWQPAVAAILVPVALLITKVAGLNPLPYTMISAIGGVALIIIFAMSRIK